MVLPGIRDFSSPLLRGLEKGKKRRRMQGGDAEMKTTAEQGGFTAPAAGGKAEE